MRIIPKEIDRLRNTPEQALDYLHEVQVRTINTHQRLIDEYQGRLNQIDDFDLTSE